MPMKPLPAITAPIQRTGKLAISTMRTEHRASCLRTNLRTTTTASSEVLGYRFLMDAMALLPVLAEDWPVPLLVAAIEPLETLSRARPML